MLSQAPESYKSCHLQIPPVKFLTSCVGASSRPSSSVTVTDCSRARPAMHAAGGCAVAVQHAGDDAQLHLSLPKSHISACRKTHHCPECRVIKQVERGQRTNTEYVRLGFVSRTSIKVADTTATPRMWAPVATAWVVCSLALRLECVCLAFSESRRHTVRLGFVGAVRPRAAADVQGKTRV